MIQLSDGSVRIFSSPRWQLEPVPHRVPRLSEDTPNLPVTPPVSLLAKVKVSASGQVVDVVSDGQQDDPKVLAWIRERMTQNWTFHPALRNGQPVDSEFAVLFLIHGKGMINVPETRPLLMPLTIIQFFWSRDLFPNDGGVDRWTVTYGMLRKSRHAV